MTLKPRAFELQRLKREAPLVHKDNADARGIGLSAAICETLPEGFITDDLRLKQILSNLVSNAIKFTDADETFVTVQHHRKGARTKSSSRCGTSASASTRRPAPAFSGSSARSTRPSRGSTAAPGSGSPSP